MVPRPELEPRSATAPAQPIGLGPASALAVEVRAPRPAELSACRRLLPTAFERGVLPDLLLATTTDPLRFVGAAAYELVSLGGQMTWSVLLEVVPAFRRRGVGTQLVRWLADRGQTRGICQLVARHDVQQQAAAAEFLRALGFRHSIRTCRGRASFERYRSLIESVRQRLVARGKVPTSARVVGLQEVPRPAVLEFFAEQIAKAPAGVEVPWPDLWSRPTMRPASLVLLDAGRVIGLGLAEVDGEQAFVHYRIVAPEHRGGWANVVLSGEMADRLQASGVRHVDFVFTTQTPDTQSAVGLYGSDCLTAQDRYVLTLDPRQGRADE